MTVKANVAAGWYRDPSGRYRERWWDGASWTGHVRGALVAAVDVDTMDIPAVVGARTDARAPTPVAASRSRFWTRWSPPVLACVYGGAAGLAVGAILSWVEVSADGYSASRNGIEGDGIITVALALAVAVVFTVVTSRPAAAIVALSLGAVAGSVAAYDMIEISNRTGDVPTGLDVSARPGVGLVLTGLVAIAITVGGALASGEAEATRTVHKKSFEQGGSVRRPPGSPRAARRPRD